MMKAVFLDLQTFSKDISDNIHLSSIKLVVSSLTCYQTTPPEKVVSRCKGAEVIIINKVVLSEEILKSLPQLKLICVSATGTNNIDIEAATHLGIKVSNASGYSNNSVAQYVFAQILEHYSNTHHHHSNTQQGLWQQSHTFCYHGNGSVELAGKTIGIIGYGSLGKSVAKLAEAFGMRVLIAERKNEKKTRSGYHPFYDVIAQADIISLHCPQTPDTEKLVNDRFLKMMKTSALLINSARGALVDNNALYSALRQKDIGHAVLDVLDQEPPPADHILLKTPLDNLTITAHIAWASIESQQRLIDIVAENIKNFLNNKISHSIN